MCVCSCLLILPIPAPHLLGSVPAQVTTFHHRNAGLTNIGLLPSFPRMPLYDGLVPPTAELIGDAVRLNAPQVWLALVADAWLHASQAHVGAASVHLALASKPVDDLIFVSDAISMPVAHRCFTYCGRPVKVNADATKVVLQDSGVVAGASEYGPRHSRVATNSHVAPPRFLLRH